MENNNLHRDIIICKCHSLQHQYSFWYDPKDNLLYCEPRLSTSNNFFKRVVAGFKYIFGYKSRFGEWDEFYFKNDDLVRLDKLIKIALSSDELNNK